MFLASMDHSPSEQLTGDPDCWHNSVLILSEGGEHWELSQKIAHRINGKSNLSKWAGSRDGYKKKFEKELAATIADFPVFLEAISAQERVIEDSFRHMVDELGLSRCVQTSTRNEKTYMSFGPFLRRQSGRSAEELEKVSFEISRVQAVPLIFICHFVLRVHQRLLQTLGVDRPQLDWLDMQLMPNKFPGGIDGRMALLFNAIMSLTTPGLIKGNLRISTLVNSNGDAGNELADNVAGLLRDKIASGNHEFLLGINEAGWEIWEPSMAPMDNR